MLEALVVLGAKTSMAGVLSEAARRRVSRAARAFDDGLAPWILVSGGRLWGDLSEADAFKSALVELGVPEVRIWAERWSTSTAENALYSARLLSSRGIRRVGIVTCDWHMKRALSCFRRVGLTATPIAARTPKLNRTAAVRRELRERACAILDRYATFAWWPS